MSVLEGKCLLCLVLRVVVGVDSLKREESRQVQSGM